MATTDNTTPAPAASAAAPTGNPARKKALTAVAAAIVVGGIAYGAYWALVLNHYESTDNAYVQGNVVQLTPQVSGTVVAINADDTDHVKAGQLLVKLDPADAQVALDQAEAQLAQTVREVRTTYANNSTLQAQIAARQADVARAQADVARVQADATRAQEDVTRRTPLLASGAVGKEEFEHSTAQLVAAKSSVAAAKGTVAAAESALRAAREQLASNQTLTDGVAVDQHPNVLRAAARVRESYLALHRADLLAPVDGFVAKRSVQLGQRVQAGAPLLSVIALNQLWVDANFKESQLKNLRIGQPVELLADVYGKKVEYHGTIEGLGAGTGAAFSLLPAQNATGNWIKVVQRVPVRIAMDPKELASHPLRVGLSMDAKVDVSKTDGPMLADGLRNSAGTQTAVFDQGNGAADDEVRKIIAANAGAGYKPTAVASAKPAAAARPAVSATSAAAAASMATLAAGAHAATVK